MFSRTERSAAARDIMVTRLHTVTPEMELRDGVAVLLRKQITGAPVVDSDGRYIGMLSEGPCMRALTAQLEATRSRQPVRVRQFMARRLVTLKPEMDAFEAIDMLLKRRISGAPVVNDEGSYLGVFSERYSMSLLIQSAYDHWPVTQVGGYLNTDRGRLIAEDDELLEVAQRFLEAYYRRLPVIRDGKPTGQVSRRDVLRAELDAVEGPSTRVGEVMDQSARTIHEDLDLLSIAQIFQSTNHRRLPVLRGDRLVGQLSRRDVLEQAQHLTQVEENEEVTPLYLSATLDRGEAPPI